MAWTPEDLVKAVRDAVAKGATLRELHEEIGASHQTVDNWLKRKCSPSRRAVELATRWLDAGCPLPFANSYRQPEAPPPPATKQAKRDAAFMRKHREQLALRKQAIEAREVRARLRAQAQANE